MICYLALLYSSNPESHEGAQELSRNSYELLLLQIQRLKRQLDYNSKAWAQAYTNSFKMLAVTVSHFEFVLMLV